MDTNGKRSKNGGWLPTIARLTESLKRTQRKPLVGSRLEKVQLHPVKDLGLISDFRALCPKFSLRDAVRAKANLIDRRYDPKKVTHVVHCWWKLKLLRDATSHHKDFCNYIQKVFDELFLPDGQKQYKDFLDFEVAALEVGDEGIHLPPGELGGSWRLDYFSGRPLPYWVRYFEGKMIHPAWFIPLSFLPFYEDISTECKTKTYTALPYSNANEDRFRSLTERLLKQYAPIKLFLPSLHACLRVGMQRYNDGGETRRDCELPKNSWDSGFYLQEFMTGPLTKREVWLPGRLTKANNSFWFSITDQILSKVPWYAYNSDTVEELYEKIRPRLEGHCVLFDISGFGIQYPRSLLRIIVEEIQKMYFETPELKSGIEYLLKLLSKVEIQVGPMEFIYPPERGLGLGYYEALKTIGVLAILMDSNPISIYGDQGLVPLAPSANAWMGIFGAMRSGPFWDLASFGFYIKGPHKAPLMTNIEHGIPWSGVVMNSHEIIHKKSILPALSGALDGEYHWERKAALASLEMPSDLKYMWNYISFQYEIAFGFEFEAGDSMNHFNNCGVNPLAIEIVGFERSCYVNSLQSPKSSFISEMSSGLHPTRNPIPAKAAKDFSKKRKEVWNSKARVPNSYSIEAIKPKITMNRTKRPSLSPLARITPFWQAARLLFLDRVDTGTITCGLDIKEAHASLYSHHLAENPFLAKATGGYVVNTYRYHQSGPPQELEELVDLINKADEQNGTWTHRSDLGLEPPDKLPSYQVTKNMLGSIKAALVPSTANPYTNSLVQRYLVEDLPESSASVTDLSEMIARIASAITQETMDPQFIEDQWDELGETLIPPGSPLPFEEVVDREYDDELGNLLAALSEDDTEEYRPQSPTAIDAGRSELTWNL